VQIYEDLAAGGPANEFYEKLARNLDHDRYELAKGLERIDSRCDAKLDVKRSERRRIGLRSQRPFRVETSTAKVREVLDHEEPQMPDRGV
jgi:hypothetical protein